MKKESNPNPPEGVRPAPPPNPPSALARSEAMRRELDLLRSVYATGMALRHTAPVDDDFPECMHNFDCALRNAERFYNGEKT